MVRNWHLYIIQASGSYYTGITTDPERETVSISRKKGAKSPEVAGAHLQMVFTMKAQNREASVLEARVETLSPGRSRTGCWQQDHPAPRAPGCCGADVLRAIIYSADYF